MGTDQSAMTMSARDFLAALFAAATLNARASQPPYVANAFVIAREAYLLADAMACQSELPSELEPLPFAGSSPPTSAGQDGTATSVSTPSVPPAAPGGQP